jgi:hypothetical protein
VRPVVLQFALALKIPLLLPRRATILPQNGQN